MFYRKVWHGWVLYAIDQRSINQRCNTNTNTIQICGCWLIIRAAIDHCSRPFETGGSGFTTQPLLKLFWRLGLKEISLNMNVMLKLCWMFLGPAIWINCFANFEYISVSTIDLLGPGNVKIHLKICATKNLKPVVPVSPLNPLLLKTQFKRNTSENKSEIHLKIDTEILLKLVDPVSPLNPCFWRLSLKEIHFKINIKMYLKLVGPVDANHHHSTHAFKDSV